MNITIRYFPEFQIPLNLELNNKKKSEITSSKIMPHGLMVK